MNAEKALLFLEEYEALVEKYRIFIDACGCCDSPFLEEYEEPTDGFLEEHIAHLKQDLEKNK